MLYQNLLLMTLLHPLKAERIRTVADIVKAVTEDGYLLTTNDGSS